MLSEATPRPHHGASRNHLVRRARADPTDLVFPGGQVARVSMSSHEATVVERYCEVCQEWMTCASIIQHMLCVCCSANWNTSIPPHAVLRFNVAPEERSRRPRCPFRIDVHWDVGAVARFEGEAPQRFATLANLCGAFGLSHTEMLASLHRNTQEVANA
jgi:hypothetical protein